MSKFKASQLRDTKDQMNIFQLQLNVVELAKKIFILLNNDIDWESFLQQEVDIVVSIRNALSWIKKYTTSLDEGLVQQVFTLYCAGFLENMNKGLQIYGVNGINLQTEIEARNSNGNTYKATLKGKADVAIGDQNLYPPTLDKLLRKMSVIGELKKSYDSLIRDQGVSASTSQQLGEMLGIAGMLRQLELDCSIVKSFLTDFFFIRLGFRCEERLESKYLISTLFQTPEEFVSCLVFIISEHSASDLDQYIENEIELEAVEDDNYVEDACKDSEDVSYQRNLIFDIENSLPSDHQQNDKGHNDSERQPLTECDNIIFMDEYDRIHKKKCYLDRLEKFEAARFGFLYLSAENLRNFELQYHSEL
jgi:hypothetical protein